MQDLDWKAIELRNPWWFGRADAASLPRKATAQLTAALRRQRLSAHTGLSRVGFAIRGMRRMGKTTLMRQVAEQLLAERILAARDVLLLDFESPVFDGRRGDSSVLEAAFVAYNERMQPSKQPLLLLDEVQVVDGWARWVRDALETGRAQVVVTGSSTRLLEPELATVLVGRMRQLTLWPMSLGEVMAATSTVGVAAGRVETQDERANRVLAGLLRAGGLPWVVAGRLADPGSRSVEDSLLRDEPFLRDILGRILQDLATRHEVRNHTTLEHIVRFALQQTGCALSLNKLKTRFGVGSEQAARYLEYAEESFLIERLERFSVHAGERARAPTKVYAVELGVRNAMSLRGQGDDGHLLETLVHNALRASSDAKLWSFQSREGQECDFVRPPGETKGLALQVCASDDLPEREVRGLQAALEAFDLEEGVILTWSLRADVVLDSGRRAKIRPVAQWLLALEADDGAGGLHG